MTKNDLQKIFSENLIRLLEEADKTQSDLAKHIGVSNTTINNYVKGYNMPRMDKIDKICNFFNIERSDLIEPPEEPTPEEPEVLERFPDDIVILARGAKTLTKDQIDLVRNLIDNMNKQNED